MRPYLTSIFFSLEDICKSLEFFVALTDFPNENAGMVLLNADISEWLDVGFNFNGASAKLKVFDNAGTPTKIIKICRELRDSLPWGLFIVCEDDADEAEMEKLSSGSILN